MSTQSTKTELTADTIAAMQLSMVPGVGPRCFQNLIDRFGSPEEAVCGGTSDLMDIPGIGQKLAAQIRQASSIDVGEEVERCQKHNIRLLPRHDSHYPTRLTEIDDCPVLLYSRGNLIPADSMAIAIVGTRHATSYGKEQARRLAHGLAMAGFTIVSGLARGIDAAAHQGALEANGRTIGVLGSGLLNIYPTEHAELAMDISRSGCVLTESPTKASPKPGSFPRRNRIVTGMSLGVIVVEAGERSGALISAGLAMEQGREVFAVPGRIDNRMSRGCHKLIRDGAKLIESIDDVIEELGPLATPLQIDKETVVHHPAELKLTEQESKILNSIQSESTSIEDVVVATGLPVHRVLSTISVLEMRRLIRKTSGSSVARI